MKNLKDKILESKGKNFEITLYFDDLKNDFYNTLSELMFRYNEVNKEPDKDELKEAFDWFVEKFFND